MRALPRLRRACLWVALAAIAWSAVIALTGGVSLPIEGLRISSRNPRNPAILSIVFAALAWVLGGRRNRTREFVSESQLTLAAVGRFFLRLWRAWLTADSFISSRTPPWSPPALATAVAVAVIVLAFTRGALVASGSDASGYVSHAQLWSEGRLKAEPPLMRELVPQLPRDVFAPLAWVAVPNEPAIVPVTGPGLPMMMALFQLVGGSDALFYVVPLMAGLAVLATYVLGSALATKPVGMVAAILLACSPSFLFQSTSAPMSDIPATVWWTLSMAWAIRAVRSDVDRRALRGSRRLALASGLAAAAAILTRPNLVLLAAVPASLVVIGASRHRREALMRVSCCIAGVVPAAVIIAALYDYWYGSPFASGYGSLGALYQWDRLAPNLTRYPRWVIESQTPVVVLAVAAPVVLSWLNVTASWKREQRAAAIGLAAFVVGILVSYAFYLVFDAWWFVRFLLPGYPALLVLTAGAVLGVIVRAVPALKISLSVLVITVVGWHGLTYAAAASAFDVAGERKYEASGRYAAEKLPSNAIILANQYSGSVRFYARRPTLRYVWLPADRLDWLVTESRRRGHDVYLLVEDYETAEFLTQFRGARAAAVVQRPPLAEVTDGSPPLYNVRIYRLAVPP